MWGAGEAEKGKEILQICGLINRAILEVPVAVFRNVIMLCFSEGGAGWSGRVEGGGGAPFGCQTQSALREGLLDLIQHIPKQRWLVTFSVNGHSLTRLGERGREVGDNVSITT